MKETGKIIKRMVLENKLILKEMFTQDSGKTMTDMVSREYLK